MREIEITVKGIPAKAGKTTGSKKLPTGLKNKAFWEDIQYNSDFPSIEEIRQTAWPKNKSSFGHGSF